MKLASDDLQLIRAMVPDQLELDEVSVPPRTTYELSVATGAPTVAGCLQKLRRLQDNGAVTLAMRVGGAEFWRPTQRGLEALEIAALTRQRVGPSRGVFPGEAAGGAHA